MVNAQANQQDFAAAPRLINRAGPNGAQKQNYRDPYREYM